MRGQELVQKHLPKRGVEESLLLEMLQQAKEEDVDWRRGKLWGLVYYPGEEHTELLLKAYRLFWSENALGPTAFPSLRRLEAEVVRMVLSILGGDGEAAGTMTSGGTESILLSVKAHRDYFREKRPGVEKPEMIIPVTAHPAFLKAAHYFGVKPVIVPVGPDFKADPNTIKGACNERTMLLVSSAPSFPQGVVDPIREIGTIALSLDIGLHVDACLGGFFLPFLKSLGHQITDFDFSVPGVTAISADLHKYGFSPKGTSAILYRSGDLRRRQFFISTEWPGGLYASPSMLGTRSGGLIAAAWTALMSLGEAGYTALAMKTMDGVREIIRGIRAIPGLKIIGEPEMSVFSFTSERDNIFGIADRMRKRGWWINRQNNPDSLHMIVTPNHLQAIHSFLEDLRESVAEEHDSPSGRALTQRSTIYGGSTECKGAENIAESLYRSLEENYRS